MFKHNTFGPGFPTEVANNMTTKLHEFEDCSKTDSAANHSPTLHLSLYFAQNISEITANVLMMCIEIEMYKAVMH